MFEPISMKASTRPGRLRSYLLGIGTGGLLTFAGAALATPREQSPFHVLEQLGRILVTVENGYVDPVERERLLTGSIKGMVAELDPHSAYLGPEDLKALLEETEGQFGGVGLEVDARGDALVVIAPIEGTPADRAGMRSGDRIVGINNDRTEGASYEALLKRMRGAPGTHVVLTVMREGSRDPLRFDLVRAVISVSSVEWTRLGEDICYVRVKQFQDRTPEEFLRAVGDLRAGGKLRGVVLDLRFNPGGLVDSASAVADEMLSGGVIFSTRHRGKIESEVRASSGGSLTKEPLVILVNEWSASAAELLTGALQDNHRARVVGANTFGKGSVQTILELPRGAGLKLTTARYYTPLGRAIQADGIHPDVMVPSKTGWPLIRERDLDGHLPAEPRGPNDVDRTKVELKSDPSIDARSPDAGAPRVLRVREMPRDPRSGEDEALKVAFRLLLERP